MVGQFSRVGVPCSHSWIRDWHWNVVSWLDHTSSSWTASLLIKTLGNYIKMLMNKVILIETWARWMKFGVGTIMYYRNECQMKWSLKVCRVKKTGTEVDGLTGYIYIYFLSGKVSLIWRVLSIRLWEGLQIGGKRNSSTKRGDFEIMRLC